MCGAQASPRKGADLASDLVGFERLAETDQSPTRPFCQTDQGMRQRAAVVGIYVDRDQGSDRVGSCLCDLADLTAELTIVACGAPEQQHELVVPLGDPTEVRLEAELGLLLAVAATLGVIATLESVLELIKLD